MDLESTRAHAIVPPAPEKAGETQRRPWTYRYPAPIAPVRRHADKETDGEDDPEIGDLTEKKPSPLVPLEHSSILLACLEGLIAQKAEGRRLDPAMVKIIALDAMHRLGVLYEKCLCGWEALQRPSPASGHFVLELSQEEGYRVHMERRPSHLLRAKRKFADAMACIDLIKD